MAPETLEPFVDAEVAADFLSITKRRVLELARASIIPAYPIGNGAHRTWRFRLSEIANALKQDNTPASHNSGAPAAPRRRG